MSYRAGTAHVLPFFQLDYKVIAEVKHLGSCATADYLALAHHCYGSFGKTRDAWPCSLGSDNPSAGRVPPVVAKGC